MIRRKIAKLKIVFGMELVIWLNTLIDVINPFYWGNW